MPLAMRMKNAFIPSLTNGGAFRPRYLNLAANGDLVRLPKSPMEPNEPTLILPIKYAQPELGHKCLKVFGYLGLFVGLP